MTFRGRQQGATLTALRGDSPRGRWSGRVARAWGPSRPLTAACARRGRPGVRRKLAVATRPAVPGLPTLSAGRGPLPSPAALRPQSWAWRSRPLERRAERHRPAHAAWGLAARPGPRAFPQTPIKAAPNPPCSCLLDPWCPPRPGGCDNLCRLRGHRRPTIPGPRHSGLKNSPGQGQTRGDLGG